MKPVDQTTFGVPGGNCFSACVASILELSIEDVPYFMGDWDGKDQATAGEWYDRFAAWLKPRGYYPLCFELDEDGRGWVPPGYHILSGQSERGPHSTVGYSDRIVHDPHPSRARLVKREDVIILVPIDPAVRG